MPVSLHDDLEGQVALVSGANRGIGHEIATRLAALGAEVYAGARNDDETVPERCRKVHLDVTDHGSIQGAIGRVDERSGRLDILVNNAGVWGASGTFHEQDLAVLDKVFAVNLQGAMALTHAALPLLLGAKGGRVVNVSSGSGSFDDGLTPRNFAYGISKAALNAFTLSLDGAYRSKGLIANAVCPGWVRTDMGGDDASRPVEKGAETPVWLARFKPGAPSGAFWRDQRPIPW